MTLWTEFLKKHLKNLYWEKRHASHGKEKIKSYRHRHLMKTTMQELSRKYQSSRNLPTPKITKSRKQTRTKNVEILSRSRRKVKRNLYERMMREFRTLGRTRFIEKYGSESIPRVTDDPNGKCFKEAVVCRKHWSKQKRGKSRKQICEIGNRFQVLSSRAKKSCLGENSENLEYWLHRDGCTAINHEEKQQILEDHPDAKFSKYCHGWKGEYLRSANEENYIFERNRTETKEFQYPLSVNEEDSEHTKKLVEEINQDKFLEPTRFKKEAEKKAFQSYVAGSNKINIMLRSHFKILKVHSVSQSTKQEILNTVLSQIHHLDNAFRTVNSVFSTSVILFRGIKLTEGSILSPDLFFRKRPFKYRELGYTSTAFSWTTIARSFSWSLNNEELEDLLKNKSVPDVFGMILVIRAPAGLAYIADNKGEHEVLLPRGLTFSIDFAKYKLLKFSNNSTYIYIPTSVALVQLPEKAPQHLTIDDIEFQ